MVTKTLQHHALNTRGRDIAVGDIHGRFSALASALLSIRFDTTRDRLFSVGDMVDRGPESAEVLQWLAHPWFHAVGGNHELLTWRRALGNPFPGVDHQVHGGRWLDACSAEQQLEIGQRLQALPLAFEIDTPDGPVGMVHADYPYDDWAPMRAGRLSDDDVHCCLWSRARFDTKYAGRVRGLRALIHGHTPVQKTVTLGNVFFIDTSGLNGQGSLSLLNLHTLKAARR
ncbi:serine/threonine protein phosphatase [Pigmentiphaga aceris]|uniref:Serine/threonine protein phosphatase n=1 Tax=Pigmentiphaga aceris TaxID=1940612 RepID=A0A5C0AX88_9BURK|nr:metallophosphoesterase [Pigmentiphaga aceris]QEI04967.1 serine/threonine protein phosphatase [Pigmentiphaga aceris]